MISLRVIRVKHKQLANAEEWQDGKNNGALGEVFIR